MSFKSINSVLGIFSEQNAWQEQPFQRLLKCWADVVGTMVALHTRPVSIQRDVLWVATSSAAWAQTLTLERQRLLHKLNSQLPTPLVDIRFSTAQWHSAKSTPEVKNPTSLCEHPSYIGNTSPILQIVDPNCRHVQATFNRWAKVMQARSQGLPLCPECDSPTPEGELQRWAMCYICAAKKW